MKLTDIDLISERLVGWVCMAATVTEYVDPKLLALDISQAAGVGAFDFLLATGRASAVVKKIGRMLS
ncbi:hypothetical protein [Sphingomonas sp. GB1N7]|uniref:hypothetical protein n=1 Tax=Parasphingomonas caseinilytica TaxID=3096158 RepID=UPI002FC7487E